jgi:predicted nucleic acid-binding protein
MRVVFDPNTVLSALLFGRGRLAWLRQVWRQGVVSPIVSEVTRAEIERVLADRFSVSIVTPAAFQQFFNADAS